MVAISAKLGKSGKPVSADYNFGKNLADLVKMYGEDTVYQNAVANMTVSLQGIIRNAIKAEKKPAEIAKTVAEWKPGARKKGKSKVEKLRDTLKGMSAEERAKLLAELSAKG